MSGTFSLPGQMDVSNVIVKTTSHRGFNAEELSEMCLNKLIHIGENVEPVLRVQALQYRDRIKQLMTHTCQQAQRSERTTMCNQLEEAGFLEAAAFIRRT